MTYLEEKPGQITLLIEARAQLPTSLARHFHPGESVAMCDALPSGPNAEVEVDFEKVALVLRPRDDKASA
jgi:uncharacterized protein (DUF2344 family)